MSEHLEGLGLVELLDLLEPVPEPAPISMVPQTVGWIWLGLAVIAGLFILARFLRRRHRANAYRRAALAALSDAGDDPADVSAILKRAAIAGFPRASVAGLSGDNWVAFLDRSCPDCDFAAGAGQAIASAPYRRDTASVTGLNDCAQTWVRRHRRGSVS